jgi:DNA-binding transcriptional regulator YiaG
VTATQRRLARPPDRSASLAEAMALRRVKRLVNNDRLRDLREAAGLSQSDVARFIGVAPSNVSRWEAGLARPRGRHAVALLELLDGDV